MGWELHWKTLKYMRTSYPSITCSKLTIETLEQGKKYIQN